MSDCSGRPSRCSQARLRPAVDLGRAARRVAVAPRSPRVRLATAFLASEIVLPLPFDGYSATVIVAREAQVRCGADRIVA